MITVGDWLASLFAFCSVSEIRSERLTLPKLYICVSALGGGTERFGRWLLPPMSPFLILAGLSMEPPLPAYLNGVGDAVAFVVAEAETPTGLSIPSMSKSSGFVFLGPKVFDPS